MDEEVFIFSKGIPASDSKPYQLEISNKVVFESKEPLDSKEYVAIKASIPVGKFTSKITCYLTIKVNEKGINDLKKFDLTTNGNYISITYDETAGLIVRQRQDDKWGDPSGTEITLEDKFDYSANALDPKLGGKVVTRIHQAKDTVPENMIYVHLQNVVASYKKPLQIFVDGSLVHTMKEKMPLNKEEILDIDLGAPKDKIKIRFKMPKFEVDAEQECNLKAAGRHIQFALSGEDIKLYQRSDSNFQKIPFQFKKEDEVDSDEEDVDPQNKPTGPVTTKIYISNLVCSKVKKCVIKVNDVAIFKSEESIPENEVVVIESVYPRPEEGEHVVKVSLLAPAMNIFEGLEDSFNLDKHGHHIFVKITKKMTGDESNQQFTANISFDQDHVPFKFEGKSIKTVKAEDPSKPTEVKPKPMALKGLIKKGVASKTAPKQETEPGKPVDAKESLSDLEAIQKLAELKDLGVLSEEEFQKKKKEILKL